MLPPFFDRPGAELLLAHRAREIRVVDVAHHLHGKIDAAARRRQCSNVVVEVYCSSHGRRGRGPRFSGCCDSWSLKLYGALRRCSEAGARCCPESELELSEFAVAAFWSYAASYAVLNGPTLRLRLNGVCSKPVAASDRLRLRFVLLRTTRTRRPTNRGPPHTDVRRP